MIAIPRGKSTEKSAAFRPGATPGGSFRPERAGLLDQTPAA
jgi:hypothetical protein